MNRFSREMRAFWQAGAMLIGAAITVAPLAAQSADIPFVAWAADHHMHLGSQALRDASDALCETLKEDDCSPAGNGKPLPAAEQAIEALDTVGARRGVVLSGAYMFGSPFLASRQYDVRSLTRTENEFVAHEVARFPGRLVGFFSVAPLQPSAVAEASHWIRTGGLPGLKLHLANSRIDFGDAQQVRKVADIVRLAGRHHLPMVIHVKGGEFTPRDAETFIRDVMPAAGDSWVQIAHIGGWGEYDDLTSRILAVWEAHFVQHDPAVRHVLFDLAYVVRPSITTSEAADLARRMRVIGLEKFVLGSDYDEATPRETDDYARAKLPLTEAEWRIIARNCAPWAC